MKKKIFRKVITDEVKVNSGVNRLIFSSKQDEMGILKKYNTSYSGYEESKVELMREKYGKNERLVL